MLRSPNVKTSKSMASSAIPPRSHLLFKHTSNRRIFLGKGHYIFKHVQPPPCVSFCNNNIESISKERQCHYPNTPIPLIDISKAHKVYIYICTFYVRLIHSILSDGRYLMCNSECFYRQHIPLIILFHLIF